MNKFISAINGFFFVILIIVGGIIFWVLPKQTISNDENRKLMEFPEANVNTVFSGTFEKAFEEYYNDHFPFRETWMNFASHLHTLKGNQDQEIRVITLTNNHPINSTEELTDSNSEESFDISEETADLTLEQNTNNFVEETTESSTESSLDENTKNVENTTALSLEENTNNNTTKKDNHIRENNTQELSNNLELEKEKTHQTQSELATSAEKEKEKPTALKIKPQSLEEDFSKVKGVVIVNGRVLQIFGGSKHTISPYVNMLNSYRKKLPSDIKMYAMMIPSGSDFYLPYQVNKGALKEKENIELFEQLLSPEIISIPAYSEIAPHKEEYIQFRTDHHWTGLGAYYAYKAFAKKLGFQPLNLNDMKLVKKEKTFLGSLYNYTKDSQLKKNPDILEYYKVPVEPTVKVFYKQRASFKGQLYSEKNNSYLLFLGGDFPLIHIQNNQAEARNLLVIKDSFGNALIPYLTHHYRDIYVVDYRYFKESIPKLIKEYAIKELLYAHNTFAANSRAASKFGEMMLNR